MFIFKRNRNPSSRRGNFGDSAINKRYIAYFSLRMRETAVFLDPDFLNVAKISAIRVHLRQI